MQVLFIKYFKIVFSTQTLYNRYTPAPCGLVSYLSMII
ncbi:hypothetical protein [Salmonella phage SD-1_S14]|nr:hypothetical protein [Salmonella phage SD-1_S14]